MEAFSNLKILTLSYISGVPSSSEEFQSLGINPRTKMLCQRMASDTDLWMSVNKAAQEKYQSSLDAKGSLISESFPPRLQSPR